MSSDLCHKLNVIGRNVQWFSIPVAKGLCDDEKIRPIIERLELDMKDLQVYMPERPTNTFPFVHYRTKAPEGGD